MSKEVKPLSDQTTPLTDHLRGLEPNWDTYGAIPVTPGALNAAEALERALTFVPHVDGGFGIEIHAAGIEIDLGFDGAGRMESVIVEKSSR